MDIDEEVESQVSDNNVEHIFTKITEANFPTLRKHTHTHIWNTENAKETRSEKKIPIACHNGNTENTQQRKCIES